MIYTIRYKKSELKKTSEFVQLMRCENCENALYFELKFKKTVRSCSYQYKK